MPSTPLLAVENLGRKLDRGWLWRGINFELQSQMRLGLIGPSGSGKTLLLRALVHLDPVDAGRVLFAGRAVDARSLSAYRKSVLYLPQRPALFEGTVEQNLKMVLQLAIHKDRPYDRARILEYLSVLGRNEDFLTRSSMQLSGGESQILNLLRGLQLNPQVLLLDEPTASLDPETTTRVEGLLDRWLEAQINRACLWTSHDPAQIDRVTNMRLDLKEFLQ